MKKKKLWMEIFEFLTNIYSLWFSRTCIVCHVPQIVNYSIVMQFGEDPLGLSNHDSLILQLLVVFTDLLNWS